MLKSPKILKITKNGLFAPTGALYVVYFVYFHSALTLPDRDLKNLQLKICPLREVFPILELSKYWYCQKGGVGHIPRFFGGFDKVLPSSGRSDHST